jgi:hypothetical protein
MEINEPNLNRQLVTQGISMPAEKALSGAKKTRPRVAT